MRKKKLDGLTIECLHLGLNLSKYLPIHCGTLMVPIRLCRIEPVRSQTSSKNFKATTSLNRRHRRRDLENLSSGVLDNMSGTLNEHLMQPWFSSPVWKPLKVPVAQLADSMHKYAVYLNEKNSIAIFEIKNP